MSTVREHGRAGILTPLNTTEIETLRSVTHHYEKVMGVARHIVVATSPRKIRQRYRYIVAESNDLDRFIDQSIGDASGAGDGSLQMSIDQAVQLWGRLLSSLKTKRSRRRLSRDAIEAQTALEARLARFIKETRQERGDEVELAINTRRRREREWMNEFLAGDDVVHRSDMANQVAEFQEG